MCPTNIPKIDPYVAININMLNIAQSTALCRNNGSKSFPEMNYSPSL